MLNTERAQLCEAVEEVAESLTKPFTTFSFDAHTALRARSLYCLCLFFALPQRIGEEKALRGLPLRTPSACAVAGEINLAARRKSRHLQILRRCFKEKHRHGSDTDFAFVRCVSSCLSPCDRQKFKQDEKAKVFAKLTHLGRALMRPRWGSFAELCFSAVLFQNGGRRSFQRRQPLVSFLATSWETPRSSVKAGTANARSSVSPATKLWEV